MKTPILMFGEDWGGHPSSTQHLANRLVNDREILWVNSIGLRRPRLNFQDIKRISQKLWQHAKPCLKTMPPSGLNVYSPLAIPWPGNWLARKINRLWLGETLNNELARRKIEKPLLWVSLPSAVDVVGKFKEKAVIYYCGDDFSGLSGVDHQPIAKMEKELAEKADLIIAASETLRAKFPAQKTICIPHGVDWTKFSTPAPRALDLPNVPKIAGFYGSISDWLDFDLIAATAALLPDWVFVMIGPVRANVSALSKFKNIRFLGEKPHHELPRYSQHWQVSLLPFKDNEQIRSCNPLKLREYLAAGPSVVSTNFPALDGYRDLIKVSSPNPECFGLQIRLAAKENSPAQIKARRERVALESWEKRAEIISNYLDQLS